MKVLIVYHRVDFDGLASMAVVRSYLEKNDKLSKKPVITLYPYTYSDPDPEENFIKQFDIVYVVDACLSTPVMVNLYKENRLVWIDHHRTAIGESFNKGFYGAPGLRREGYGACELCYQYLWNKDAPELINLLSAYDVFDKERFDWENLVLPFQFGMRNRFNLDAEAFYEAYEADIEQLKKEVLSDGKAIVHYLRNNGDRSISCNGVEVMIGGKAKGICVLTDLFGSVAYEQAARENDYEVVVCLNRASSGQWKVSCYSTGLELSINLGAYLKETYGGGGHPGAAGATIDEQTALRILNEGIL